MRMNHHILTLALFAKRKNYMRYLIFISILTGCGTVPNPFDKHEERPEEVSAFDAAYDRLVSEFLHEGHYIVSRKKDGSVAHAGEAILWAGVAAGSLPCDKAKPFADFLAQMAIDNGGYFERYKPLGDDYAHRPINFDGMSGVYRGFAGYVARCGADAHIKNGWAFHKKYLDEAKGQLHPDYEGEVWPSVFDSVRDAIDYRMGYRSAPPTKDALKVTATTATTWALGVVASKAACYRIHLAYLNLKSLEELGFPTGRNSFCKATGKIGKPEETAIGIPLIDHWCGRGDLHGWLDAFAFNAWEYQFQRCTLWETPDGKGYETPGLDYLVGYSALH